MASCLQRARKDRPQVQRGRPSKCHMLILWSLCPQSPKGSSGHSQTRQGRGEASVVREVDRRPQSDQTQGAAAWTGGPASRLDCDPASPFIPSTELGSLPSPPC